MGRAERPFCLGMRGALRGGNPRNVSQRVFINARARIHIRPDADRAGEDTGARFALERPCACWTEGSGRLRRASRFTPTAVPLEDVTQMSVWRGPSPFATPFRTHHQILRPENSLFKR
ncbi:hypothetical protein AAFF_G00389520 [Aldrovandia affinis]|uniref:Uncharacterized protein n=1 Tax=Aldrovandia affinis TaxID=143900 RepID=A0AAD7WLD8_9TELE|nr:hypothetical protein AAFF_G00389520 [Aldrovandia affinis]